MIAKAKYPHEQVDQFRRAVQNQDKSTGDSGDERGNARTKAVPQDKSEGYNRRANHRHKVGEHHRGNATVRVTLERHAAAFAAFFGHEQAFEDVFLAALRAVTPQGRGPRASRRDDTGVSGRLDVFLRL